MKVATEVGINQKVTERLKFLRGSKPFLSGSPSHIYQACVKVPKFGNISALQSAAASKCLPNAGHFDYKLLRKKKNGETGGREKRELLDMCLTLIVDKLGGEDARRNSGNENVELGRSRPPDQEDLWAQEISDKFRFHKKK